MQENKRAFFVSACTQRDGFMYGAAALSSEAKRILKIDRKMLERKLPPRRKFCLRCRVWDTSG
jgi:hypothetical protein